MKYLSLILIIVFSVSCVSKNEKVPPLDTSVFLNKHQVVVGEIIQTSKYSYLKVSEKSKTYWIAVVKGNYELGDTLLYESGLEMNDFKSKELNRVFDQVLFVDKASKKAVPTSVNSESVEAHSGLKTNSFNDEITIEKPKGGVTIAKLYSNKNEFESETVTVRGKVVKVNNSIMGRNWVHLQDGTNSNGKFDLTLTTNEIVKVGDIVTMTGVVRLDKDFGSGYFYDLIIENAKLK